VAKLLILSSNPRRDLNLDREISDLNNALQRLGKFEIFLGLGVRAQELSELIAHHSPEFVHFCGHGAGEQGLVFQDEDGREQLVSTDVLSKIFKTFSTDINCTVLNACDSEQQATAIVEHINYVIGMSQPILDKAAHLFSIGFYQGLGAGKSIEQSYDMGCIAIQIWSETVTKSTPSRRYRKLKFECDVDTITSLRKLEEYEKPVLLKRTAQETVAIAASQEFVDFVRQEVDRQIYKENAREAYDNFGQFFAQKTAVLSKTDSGQRQILLDKVKKFWIEGFLQPSIQGLDAISFELKDRPDAIADLTEGIEALAVELDPSYERLRTTPIYEEMGEGRTLLMLGSPGAGKTIALLQLAQRLIERSEKDLSLPIPVVLNLSSWAREKRKIFDWLMDELLEKYKVPKSLSETWIQREQLILLLDGLDEVNEVDRNRCVQVLNDFMMMYPQTDVAICSRVRDYEVLTERLQISSALCLQPLSSQQVYQILDKIGGALTGLKTLLKNDPDLEQFARTPLILNFMSVAYRGWTIEKLRPQLQANPDRERNLFDTYIDFRLNQGASSGYSPDRVRWWLSWLARRLQEEKRTIFLLERMQPTWLNDQSEDRDYRIKAFMFCGLISGFNGLLIGKLTTMLISSLTFGNVKIDDGLLMIFAVTAVFVGGTVTALPRKISPLEQLSWSRHTVQSRWIREFFTGIGYGLILTFILALVSQSTMIGLFGGMILVLVSVLFSGLGSSDIEKRTIPNQGIYSSIRNCIIIGLIGGLLFALIFWLSLKLFIGDKQIGGIWLIGGLISGLFFGLKYGGTAWNQHYVLRVMLHQKGRIPWNYAKFLDFASDRLLMKKVGGGYVFFHRMLLEHFARMNYN
jgi:NACHT domain/CHAT domain